MKDPIQGDLHVLRVIPCEVAAHFTGAILRNHTGTFKSFHLLSHRSIRAEHAVFNGDKLQKAMAKKHRDNLFPTIFGSTVLEINIL